MRNSKDTCVCALETCVDHDHPLWHDKKPCLEFTWSELHQHTSKALHHFVSHRPFSSTSREINLSIPGLECYGDSVGPFLVGGIQATDYTLRSLESPFRDLGV